jgi:hypothetical protein
MKLTIAQPAHAPVISGFYKKTHDESFSHPEMFSAETVAQLLRDQELALIIASDDSQLLGCAIGLPQHWNTSLEMGAVSVAEVEGRGQIAKALFDALRHLGTKQYGLTTFRARNEAAFRRARELGAMCWGFWPKPGGRSLDGAEMIMGFYDEQGDIRRAEPPDNVITRLPFAQRVLAEYQTVDRNVQFPKNYPVGSPRGTGAVVVSGRIWPSYHSRGNFITIESSAGPYPTEIIREFVEKVRSKGVRDIRMSLPVSQDQAFVELLALGFQPTAYLPGWYLRGPNRFDCVELVAGLSTSSADDQDFLVRAISKIIEGLKPAR